MKLNRLAIALVALLIAVRPVRATDPNAASPFGINGPAWFRLGANTPAFDKEAGLKRLKLLKDTGAKWDRCDFLQSQIEPQPGQSKWDDVDWVVQQYKQAGISLMPTLCAGPTAQPSAAPANDADRARFAHFVGQAVARYKNDVHTWEIWDEPNTPAGWPPSPDPRDYVKLLKAAYAEAKRADPDCAVVAGATAGVDYGFLESVLQFGGADALDAVSVHAYPGVLGSASPDSGGLAHAIRGVHALLAEYGLSKPVLVTAIGHRTAAAPGTTAVTPDQQASYLVRAYVLALTARADRVFWSTLHDGDEPWGITDAGLQPKPAFRAYQALAKQLSGRQCIGVLNVAPGVAAYVFSSHGRGTERSDAPGLPNDPASLLLVSWRPDDADDASPIVLPGRQHERLDGKTFNKGEVPLDGRPIFSTGLAVDDLAKYQPLPPLPPLNKDRRTPTKPALLPKTFVSWPASTATQRFMVAVAFAEPARADTPIVIPAARIPKIISANRRLDVYEPDARRGDVVATADRDLDGNAVFLVPPSHLTTRSFYLYPGVVNSGSSMTATDETLSNGLITVPFADRLRAKGVRLKNGYTSLSDESGGLFDVSYSDSTGATVRVANDAARVVRHDHYAGAAVAQYRTRVAVGADKGEYEFTYTVYAGQPVLNYTGRWVRGAAATRLTPVADAYPAGTPVIGLYGQATLPATPYACSHAAYLRPANHPSVTAILVCPAANLRTSPTNTRSLIATPMWTPTQAPATVSADYYWYDSPPKADPAEVLREHYLRSAYPPVLTFGPFETKR